MASYKIKSGDTLTSIAKKYGTTVGALASANKITNPNKIYAGSSIVIPGSSSSSKASTSKTSTAPKKAVTTNANKPSTATNGIGLGSSFISNALDGGLNLLKNLGSNFSTNANSSNLASIERAKPVYNQSYDVTKAADMLSQYEKNKPGAYVSNYSDQIKSLLNDIQNRPDFNYNMNADPLYQQYKDQYINQGNLAMQDTMGNAAALTGGYGSSYATTAGNQAYQANLAQLNNVVPELYGAAQNQYNNKGTEMYNQFGLLQSQDEADYNKHQANVDDYYNDLNYYYNKYNNMSANDYNKYMNDLGAWENDRNYYYGKEQDALAQSNYQTEFGYQKEQDALAQNNYLSDFGYQKEQDQLTQNNYLEEMAFQKAQADLAQSNWQKQYNLSAQKSKSSSSGGSNKSSNSSSTKASLLGSSNKTNGKTQTTSSNKGTGSNLSAEIDNVLNSSGKSAAVKKVENYYNMNLISESQAKEMLTRVGANDFTSKINSGVPFSKLY